MRLVTAGHSLDERFGDATHTVDLRRLYTHMIGEYIRPNGHADLIRELVDGMTGYWAGWLRAGRWGERGQ